MNKEINFNIKNKKDLIKVLNEIIRSTLKESFWDRIFHKKGKKILKKILRNIDENKNLVYNIYQEDRNVIAGVSVRIFSNGNSFKIYFSNFPKFRKIDIQKDICLLEKLQKLPL